MDANTISFNFHKIIRNQKEEKKKKKKKENLKPHHSLSISLSLSSCSLYCFPVYQKPPALDLLLLDSSFDAKNGRSYYVSGWIFCFKNLFACKLIL